MTAPAAGYVRYSDSLESPKPDEQRTFDEIAAAMRRIAEMINDRSRHAVRAVHAKSHGLLRADLTVADGLPEHLAQGLFKGAGNYPAIVRFSTNPGDILPDSISTPRGMAVKLIGVEGEMLPDHQGEVTQDLVMVNDKVLPVPDSDQFLKGLQILEKHVNDSEALKQFVSTGARAVETVLEAFHTHSAALLGFGHPETNLLGETFSTVAPRRYGDYVAKISVQPSSPNLKALTHKSLETGGHSAVRDAVVQFFKTERAVWDVKVQLCTSLDRMPIEDTSVAWPEDLSPYIAVGQLVAEPQDAYSPARRIYVDELLSFTPWHALAAHRPLGNIMRARKKSYPASSLFRHLTESRAMVEPKSISDLPA
jgi:hypothetical protein